jgi:hypothetical protein
MMGQNKQTRSRSLSFIPVIGVVAVHGKDDVIPAGAVLTAYVAKNTKITPGEVAQTK